MNSPSRRLEDLSTPSLDNESTYLLYQEGSHAIYWLGISNDSAFRCNVYLIKDGEQGLLVDPGGSASFLQIHTAVEAIMPTEQLDGMILCHQDPDVSASMVDWLKINPQMKVISSPRTHVLLPHYGASDYRVFDVEKHPVYCFRSGRQLRFIPDLSGDADQRLRQALAQAQRQAHLRDRALADLRRAEMQLEREHKRTEIIERMQSRFIAESDNFSINQNLLNDLLELTGSEFGFTGETNKTHSADDLIATADRCLYQAKSAGRNRIVSQAQCADERLMDSGD